MIKLDNISVSYENNLILDNINLSFNKGEINMIIGINGSGKSTLLNTITNLIKYKGNIIIDNLELKEYSNLELRKKVGIVFQNPNNQIICNKVIDDIKFTLDNLNIKGNIEESLNKMNMLDYINKNPYNLSLGEKQKINLSNILCINPDYYIFDEITAMIDYKSKLNIYEIIKYLKNNNKGIIMTTNSMEELLLADNIIIINNKKINIIKKEDLLDNINLIKKSNLEIPFIIDLLLILKEKGYSNLDNNSILELIKDKL